LAAERLPGSFCPLPSFTTKAASMSSTDTADDFVRDMKAKQQRSIIGDIERETSEGLIRQFGNNSPQSVALR
jgi:hypothetical protein